MYVAYYILDRWKSLFRLLLKFLIFLEKNLYVFLYYTLYVLIFFLFLHVKSNIKNFEAYFLNKLKKIFCAQIIYILIYFTLCIIFLSLSLAHYNISFS
ncbi:hypothetical protein PUN28_011575 [Cardiocondyla obscurior]|uniref:Uncharacterized protein n=1 Tax=Cardiocondyla obscurior TaxID=286306 RepID=A0AAW2FKE5_9HYME